MVQNTLASIIIVACYLCLAIILFAPSLYAGWFYVVSRKVPGRSKRMLRIAVSTFAINLIFAFFLFHLAFDYFLPSKDAERDAMAMEAVRNAVASQERSYASRGRYYSVGPVRGPYEDEFGLKLENDVIVQVLPSWDKVAGKDSFRVYAVHVWGTKVLVCDKDGRSVREEPDEAKAAKVRGRLFRSVK